MSDPSDRFCDCSGRRTAYAVLVVFFLLMILLIAAPAPASDHELQVCAKIPLPGNEHVLNPGAPIEKQVRETVTACETVVVPDPQHFHTPYEPITDYRHDRRARA